MGKMKRIAVIKPLNGLSDGEAGTIVQILGKPEMQRYLYSLGLVVGNKLVMDNAGSAPQYSSVNIKVGDKLVTLEKDIADNIKVQVPGVIDEKDMPDMAKGYARVYIPPEQP